MTSPNGNLIGPWTATGRPSTWQVVDRQFLCHILAFTKLGACWFRMIKFELRSLCENNFCDQYNIWHDYFVFLPTSFAFTLLPDVQRVIIPASHKNLEVFFLFVHVKWSRCSVKFLYRPKYGSVWVSKHNQSINKSITDWLILSLTDKYASVYSWLSTGLPG